ncbi:MAG: hypothetical protein ACOYKI_03385 [Sediminibacterium sp.]
MQENYQDLEIGMQNLLPMERQMLLAKIYHYAWYNKEAYDRLITFVNYWEKHSEIKAVFLNQDSEESTNQI